jgi:tetratricopeptide (TPR) repeat protein
MADGTAKPVIFISYSHRDRAWLDYVRSFLAPLAKQGTLTIWDDEKLQIGDDWKGDIFSALDACNIFILLVSRYALASDFILNDEVARILKRPKADVRFCPIVVTPCHMDGIDWLGHPNRRPKDGKALSELPDPERDREMVAITGQIATASKSQVASPKPSAPGSSVIAYPSIVDYAHLPETPYKNLVGREVELKRLDDAWSERKTNIISLIAWGGAGKTALVNEWMVQLRRDNYRGASAVLGWSFYSQGTKERATSAEGFLDWALGKLDVKVDTTSATIKGEKLAEAMAQRRALLVLDGVEPLQFGPEGQKGALKDQGLRAFLRRLAAMPPATTHGLIVLTSRLQVRELEKWKDDAAPVVELGRLSDEAGAVLLADNGVKGSSKALQDAAHDFAGHALALSLLASFLKELHHGDVRQRDRIRALLNDPNDPGHDHARRVMESYETEWLAHEPILQTILYLIGLFDRPASADCLAALRKPPVIAGLNETIIDLDDANWRRAIARLRDVRLLDPEDPSMPDALDAHPLVREWFGERLRKTRKNAWREAHGRLYEHLRDTTKEGDTPTLEDLAPIYQSIAHGCRAGKYQETLEQIYINRICRRASDGSIKFYATNTLGAFGSNLAAISWFFERPYISPYASLNEHDQSWILAQAATIMWPLGRVTESLQTFRLLLIGTEKKKDWFNAAAIASNLSSAALVAGDIVLAIKSAKTVITYATRAVDEHSVIIGLTECAAAMNAAGVSGQVDALFSEAIARRLKSNPGLLISGEGNRYCDYLIDRRKYLHAIEHAQKTIVFSRQQKWLLIIARDLLVIGRAHFGLVMESVSQNISIIDCSAETKLASDWIANAVEALQSAGQLDEIPRGLLTRAIFSRNVGDWAGVVRDLDEVEEIAEPGHMRLFLCDMALERARLAFAQIDAFAPLYGLLEKDNPPKPAVPDAARMVRLKSDAVKQLAIAADYIEKCGYHRRDEELAELQDVLAGKRKFADLPPRV